MTQRRQISVHLGMTLLIPLKSDSSLMLSTFIQRQKTFLSFGKICSTFMLRESPVCNISSLSVNCPSLPPWFWDLSYSGGFSLEDKKSSGILDGLTQSVSS